MPILNSDGISIFYEIHGAGQPISKEAVAHFLAR
jgi:hypothetical protein